MTDSRLTTDQLNVGDVLHWLPENRHCREGVAVVSMRDDGSKCVSDTFWGSGTGAHLLTADELAGATVEWNMRDFRVHDCHVDEPWEDFAPENRRYLPSQHGLQAVRYVRLDATTDLDTMIENARVAVRDAEVDLASAERNLDLEQGRLSELETRAQERRLAQQ